jgi:hypothetical protein
MPNWPRGPAADFCQHGRACEDHSLTRPAVTLRGPSRTPWTSVKALCGGQGLPPLRGRYCWSSQAGGLLEGRLFCSFLKSFPSSFPGGLHRIREAHFYSCGQDIRSRKASAFGFLFWFFTRMKCDHVTLNWCVVCACVHVFVHVCMHVQCVRTCWRWGIMAGGRREAETSQV